MSVPFFTASVSAANLLPKVEPHAHALEQIAAMMEADGIGGDFNNGYVKQLLQMAACMRADAALGRMPSAIHAAGNSANPVVAATLRACRSAGVDVPASGRFTLEGLNAALDVAFPKSQPMSLDRRLQLKNQIAAAGMLTEDLPAANVKIVEKAVTLLRKAGIPVPTTHMFTLDDINAALDKTTLSPSDRIELKTTLTSAGLMERTGTVVPLQRPNVTVARSVFAQLELDEPRPGEKVSLGKLNAAMDAKGFSTERRIHTKATLYAAGLLQS
jgi:hypothetical protein